MEDSLNIKAKSDNELIALISAKDELSQKAFEELFGRYERKIFLFIQNFISNEKSVEDLFQDVFAKVYIHANNFNNKYQFSTWIYKIAGNLCINYLKKKGNSEILLDNNFILDKLMTGKVESAEEEFLKVNELKELEEAFVLLKPKIKAVMVLRIYNKMPFKDIARTLNCSIRTAKWRMKKGLDILYSDLKKHRDNN